jgi:arylsulfatase B
MATPEHTPSGRGYESWLGYFHHANDYYTETLTGGSTVVTDVCGRELGLDLVDLWSSGPAGSGPARHLNGTQYEEYLFTDNSLKVINEHNASNAAAPLFLVHAFHTVHTPLQIPEERIKHFKYLENKDRRTYAAMVAYMDSAIGQFVTALEKKGMWENTLLILSSDNGGPIYGTPGSPTDLTKATFGAANNLPLRGGKTSDWEGGIRVNAFVAGGAVPLGMRGTVLDDYIHIADWYATLCAIAGVDALDERAAAKNVPAVDSMNMWPLLSGKVAPGRGPRHEIHVSRKTLIQGKYKLLTGSDGAILKYVWRTEQPAVRTSSRLTDLFSLVRRLHHEDLMTFDVHGVGWGPAAVEHSIMPGRNCSRGCLFDIMADPNEDHQIKDQPEVVAQMMQRLQELNKSNFNPNRGAQNKLACEVAVDKYGGFYGPFIDVGYALGDARSYEEHMANAVSEIAFADATFTALMRS